ncbi:hypothetical protein FRC07_014323, partial [Ceratobasidium sp. 392]
FHTTLGDRQGTRHSSVSIDDDIRVLTASLRDHRVYELVPGRAFDPEDSPPKDVISEGYRRLAHGSKRTIDNYNEYFKNLQRRFKISPVSSAAPRSAPDQQPAPEGSQPEPEAGGQDDAADLGQDRDAVHGDAEAAEDGDVDEDDDAVALFDWGPIEEEDITGIGFSDEDVDVDEESDSGEELGSDEEIGSGEEL